jgi:8-amino-7-oxononanoate synthase
MRSPSIAERMAREIGSLREQSQFRTLQVPAGINFCSNDSLGLASDPRLREAVTEAIGRADTVGSTGSRLLSGNCHEWEEAESAFAEFAGTEAALYFGSGYAANVGLLSCLLKPGDMVFSDSLNHASLIDGMRLSGATKVLYPHRDLKFLEETLREHKGVPGSKLIVTESVFSMEGDVAAIDSIVRLAKEFGAEVVVDEAHATGICGPQGRGIVAEFMCQREILAAVHTCGKALASAGAFVCGGNILKSFLVNRARTFIFSTAMPPYLAGQIQAAFAIARESDLRRAHLREIADLLREMLAARGFNCGASTTHIVPVMLGNSELALQVADDLQCCGFAVKAIRPPTVPVGTARIRLSLTSLITREEIRGLVAAIDAACPSIHRNPSAHAVHA